MADVERVEVETTEVAVEETAEVKEKGKKKVTKKQIGMIAGGIAVGLAAIAGGIKIFSKVAGSKNSVASEDPYDYDVEDSE